MKTANFKSFAQDKLQENELNYLKGGIGGEPVTDLVHPPKR